MVGMEPVGDASAAVLIHNRRRARASDRAPKGGDFLCLFLKNNKSGLHTNRLPDAGFGALRSTPRIGHRMWVGGRTRGAYFGNRRFYPVFQYIPPTKWPKKALYWRMEYGKALVSGRNSASARFRTLLGLEGRHEELQHNCSTPSAPSVACRNAASAASKKCDFF